MTINRRRFALTSAAAMFAPAAMAQAAFPNRAITLIVPFAPGGPTDIVGRLVGEALAAKLGQPVIIENVAGAAGVTGAARAAKAEASGHTLVVGNVSTHATAVTLQKALPYDPAADFEPVGLMASTAIAIVVKNTLPVNTLAEFVALLKRDGAKLSQASAGVGATSHVSCLVINAAAGAASTHVPYRGTGPAMNDLIAGHIDYMCDQIVSLIPQIKAGQVKALAVAQPKRSPALPDVMTAEESGLKEFAVTGWNALFAPKGTPPDAVAKLEAALSAALDDPALRRRLADDLGADLPEPAERGGAPLRALVTREVARWRGILTAAGVKAE